jgi:hypothetical protein
VVTSFEDIERTRVEHFEGIYKEERRAIILEVVKMTSFFPNFVSVENNENLMEEVSKEELQEVLIVSKKEKIQSSMGGQLNFLGVL